MSCNDLFEDNDKISDDKQDKDNDDDDDETKRHKCSYQSVSCVVAPVLTHLAS